MCERHERQDREDHRERRINTEAVAQDGRQHTDQDGGPRTNLTAFSWSRGNRFAGGLDTCHSKNSSTRQPPLYEARIASASKLVRLVTSTNGFPESRVLVTHASQQSKQYSWVGNSNGPCGGPGRN